MEPIIAAVINSGVSIFSSASMCMPTMADVIIKIGMRAQWMEQSNETPIPQLSHSIEVLLILIMCNFRNKIP